MIGKSDLLTLHDTRKKILFCSERVYWCLSAATICYNSRRFQKAKINLGKVSFAILSFKCKTNSRTLRDCYLIVGRDFLLFLVSRGQTLGSTDGYHIFLL